MGLMNWFSGGKDGQVKRHSKRLTNLNAQVEDREASAHWLAQNGSEQAILGLLGRFTITYEHQMKDMNEKDLVMSLLKGCGVDVTGPIKTWAKSATQFARPLTLVDHFEGQTATVGLLAELLKLENDPFKPEKKRQVLIRMADYQDALIRPAILESLRDFDEGIRYAAVEALLAQEDSEIQADLTECLADDKEDSNRLRVRIAEAFNHRGWDLGASANAISENPPHGWTVQGDRLIPA
jgi:HEAT repeat protein